ncbi:hypothetical protein [Pseudomonas protegens]|uniref:hypothetical protein n=1 Tax=Pseudomonas protegens TaxID=380021 RepID=UPI001F3ACF8D|nr:hypothetical protein [Pseudomonas protegens]
MIRYLSFLLLLQVGSASAYDPQRASNNLAHEFAECAAYYSISSAIISRTKPEVAKQIDVAAERAFVGARTFTSKKVTEARIEMAIKSMTKELDNDIANFSVLINEYSDSCQEAVTDPEARMNYWLKKEG